MSVLQRVERWWDPGKPIRTLLLEARGLLPGDTPNPVIDDGIDECRLLHVDEFIEHAEWECALDSLIYIADACAEGGRVVPIAFWRKLLRAAELMELSEQAQTCRLKIHEG